MRRGRAGVLLIDVDGVQQRNVLHFSDPHLPQADAVREGTHKDANQFAHVFASVGK